MKFQVNALYRDAIKVLRGWLHRETETKVC
jgi:hypothetical protein